MAKKFLTGRTLPTVGTAASQPLVPASVGSSVLLWQVSISTTTATTDNVIFQDGSGGTTLLNVQLPVNRTLVLPFTGVPLAVTTPGNGLFFNTAATTVVTAYYTLTSPTVVTAQNQVLVFDSFNRPNGALGGNWGPVVSYTDSLAEVNFSNGGIQLKNGAFAPLDSAGSAAMSAWQGTFSNNQFAQAQIATLAINTSTVSISACSSSGGTSTYTYTLTAGNALLNGQWIFISGMQNAGNNSPTAGFKITGLGAGTFNVANGAPGPNESGSTGSGVSASDSICGVAVRCALNGTSGYALQIGNNSGAVGNNGNPIDHRQYAYEMWKVNTTQPATIVGVIISPYPTVINDSVGDIIKFRAIGTNLTALKNGEVLGGFTDSSYASGSVGISTFSVGGAGEWAAPTDLSVGNSGTSWTNFTGGSAQQSRGFTFVQATVGGSASTVSNLAYSSNNTAGNLLVCQLAFDNQTTFSSITDSQGNVWKQIGPVHTIPSTNNRTALFYVASCKGGANTVTVTVTGTVIFNNLGISEYSPGAGNVASLDGAFYAVNNSQVTSLSIGSIFPMTSAELVLGCFYVDNLGETFTATGGYTRRYGSTTSFALALEDIVVGSAGSQTATATINIASRYQGWCALFSSGPA